MSDFWTNISRYPSFFISSVTGSILVIIAPLRNLFKVPKLRVILLVSCFIFGLLLYLTIRNMIGL